MQNSLTWTALALVLIVAAGGAQAQSLRNADVPAEFPPSSYTGKQYVDSKGCVFVRAGFDGNVTWVPRVSRKRQVLCGFQPTFAARTAPAEPPAQVAAAPVPRAAPPVQTKPRPAPAAAPRPAPVAVKPRPAAAPRPAPVIAQTAPAPARARIYTAPPAPLAAGRVASACPGNSTLGQQYLRSNGGYAVRCGPQADHPANYATRYASAPGVIRVPVPPQIAPPPGYKAAFEEDRFNPYRGLQTREGFVQMRLVWSSGVPRRLYDRTTGRDVTTLFPGLRYPSLDYDQQQRYVAVNPPVVSAKNRPPAAAVPNQRVSSKAVPAGHRFVQVGIFRDEANARNTAAKLGALGLPARLGSYAKAGKVYRIVVAGPYDDAGALQAGLAAVRRAGFGDAYTRK